MLLSRVFKQKRPVSRLSYPKNTRRVSRERSQEKERNTLFQSALPIFLYGSLRISWAVERWSGGAVERWSGGAVEWWFATSNPALQSGNPLSFMRMGKTC
jgi:hypothetical protein